MNTRRNVTRWVEKEISNAGVPPRGDQVPPLEEDANDDQAPVDPHLTYGAIRAAFLQMAQAITTQAQVTTMEAQSMMTQANREVVPRANQQVATISSRVRDFNRINPPTFYGSKVEEDHQDFIDEIYKILYFMGLRRPN